MQDSFFDSADRLFAQECTPAQIRQIEAGGDTSALWQQLVSAGFADALLPDNADGAGLTLAEAWPILFCMGRHVLPLPYAQTMLARAWLHQHGQAIVEGTITFAPFQVSINAAGLHARAVNFGRTADWVLAQHEKQVWLLPVSQAQVSPSGAHGSLDADLHWPVQASTSALLGDWATPQFRDLLALSLAVLIAGAADRVFEMTLSYANQRVQFGKPIGKFQALQQQISEMAELAFGARMASEMSCRSATWQPAPMLAALAKSQASQSVARVTAYAHAVHGAIGVTHEFDLQLYTRRLNEWSRAGGGASYWASVLGQQALDSGKSSLDFIRCEVFAEAEV
jgi:alkylation response protein AidB-like acyl-CoA dehydrogenase